MRSLLIGFALLFFSPLAIAFNGPLLYLNVHKATTAGHAWFTFDNGQGSVVDVGMYPKTRIRGLSSHTARFSNSNGEAWYRWCYNLPVPIYNELVACTVLDMGLADGTIMPQPGEQPPKYNVASSDADASNGIFNCVSWPRKKLLDAGLNAPDMRGFPAALPDTQSPTAGVAVAKGQLYGNLPITPGTQLQDLTDGDFAAPSHGYGATPHMCPIQLSVRGFLMNADLAAYLGYPVYDTSGTSVTIEEGDHLGIIINDPNGDNIAFTALQWGDGSSYDYHQYGDPIDFETRERNWYSKPFDTVDTHVAVALIFMENGIQRISFTVNVVVETGNGTAYLRHYINPTAYTAPANVPYTDENDPVLRPQ